MHWSRARSAATFAELTSLALAVLPPVATHDDQISVRVVLHLLLASVAPLLLALSAPATLTLRTLPKDARGVLLRLLHSHSAKILTDPAVLLTLEIGGL